MVARLIGYGSEGVAGSGGGSTTSLSRATKSITSISGGIAQGSNLVTFGAGTNISDGGTPAEEIQLEPGTYKLMGWVSVFDLSNGTTPDTYGFSVVSGVVSEQLNELGIIEESTNASDFKGFATPAITYLTITATAVIVMNQFTGVHTLQADGSHITIEEL